MTLENGLQIWQALLRSGLEPARKNELPGYDAELADLLKERLFPKATASFDRELRANPPTTEIFLDIFFSALKPFSQMLREVLAMFETAGARRSDENLRIAFDFDKGSEALTLTLQEFREIETYFREVTRPIVSREWNSDTLWLLNHDIESVLEPLGVSQRRHVNKPSPFTDPYIRQWIESNGRPNWIPFPGFPRSDVAELDKTIKMAEELIHYMLAEVLKLGSTYQQFAERLPDLASRERDELDVDGGHHEIPSVDELPRRSFVIAAHDFWPNTFAKNMCLAIEAVNKYKVTTRQEASEKLAQAIKAGFERPPTIERTRVTLEQQFLELINLPIWKKRHELYAVWVATRIADALSDCIWEWHPDDETLRFSFSGAQLATVRSDGGTHAFWTEKRSALKDTGLFGRKHIQPDYRIITAPTHRHDATTLVVECKQYRRWNKRNFGAALDDYAKGCPKAPIILVNYGPTDRGILDLVDPSRRDRTFLVGNFRPFEPPALDRFQELVRDAYATVITRYVGGNIELRWGPMLRDLDLHVFVDFRSGPVTKREHIGFGSSTGSLTEHPWMEWSGDIQRSSPGIEEMTISRWLEADYDVFVHNYSGTPDFANGDLSIRINFRGQDHLIKPKVGHEGQWWYVCRIQGPESRIDEINEILAACPYSEA